MAVYFPKQLRPTDVRLIRYIGKSEDGTMQYAVTEHCLDRAPPYFVLSYTWGPAEAPTFTSLSSGEPTKDPCFIILDGHHCKITANLFDLLEELFCQSSIEGYFWVDAVCINQEDDDEKSAQVNMMDRIYELAFNVIAWLGKANDNTNKVKFMIHQLAKVCETWERDNTFSSEFGGTKGPTDSAFLRSIGLAESTSWDDWNELFYFYQRRWLTRVWTVQELALAQCFEIRCGRITFDFYEICQCAVVLSNSSLGTRILMTNADKSSETIKLMFHVLVHRAAFMGVHDPTRQGSGIWLSDGVRETSAAMNFLLISSRSLGATDPRDKVYGPLGVWARISMQRSGVQPSIQADYQKSVQDVYTEAMANLLRETGSLTFLSAVQPGSSTTSNLPTWVADYTTPSISPIIQYLEGKANIPLERINAWKTAPLPTEAGINPSLGRAPDAFEIEGASLLLSTITYGTVVSVGQSNEELYTHADFYKTVKLLVASPEIYLDGRERLKAYCSTLAFDVNPPPAATYWSFFMHSLIVQVYSALLAGCTLHSALEPLSGLDVLAATDSAHYMPSLAELKHC
ncbi:heterokaryon incompatibility protein-domain-containing protein [Xylariales sp. AK1849]|nr:heterokaryon incompatibility protein-domain-containing protein [Xylariales sp. AK1849]